MNKIYMILLTLSVPIIILGNTFNIKSSEHNYYETMYLEGCTDYVQERVSELSSTEVILCLDSWQCAEGNISTKELRKVESQSKGTNIFYLKVNELVKESCKEFFVDYWWEVYDKNELNERR